MFSGLQGRSATALVMTAAALAGCGDDDGGPATPSGELVVLAAASLTESFAAVAEAFETEFPDVSVTLSFSASSELVTQINEGAPADVFASADEATMQRLVDGIGTRGDPRPFTTNVLEIVVEAGNPRGIDELDDLAEPGMLFVAATPEAPIGAYTLEMLDRAGVEVTPRSLEASVRGVVAKVALGEADAGIVYRTDVLAGGDRVSGVGIRTDLNVVARYPIAVTAESTNPVTADAFVELVLSADGQEILSAHGFGAP